MLKTRILTAAVLSGVLLAGLFLLSPPAGVLAFGAVFCIGAWEWSGFGALRGLGPRAAYTAGIALALLLAWRWTAEPLNLVLLLAAACVWWMAALLWLCWVPSRHHPALVL